MNEQKNKMTSQKNRFNFTANGKTFGAIKTFLFTFIFLIGIGGASAFAQRVSYTPLVDCTGSDNQFITAARIQRGSDVNNYRKAQLVLFDGFGLPTFFQLTDANWKTTNDGQNIKTFFNAGTRAQLRLNSDNSFMPISATVFLNGGRSAGFSRCTQTTSAYYWTFASQNVLEAFVCPETGMPGGCPKVKP